MTTRRHGIALGVLAGGAGRRTGGQDKGWIAHADRPAVVALVGALRADIDQVLISANRNAERYAALGCVVADSTLDRAVAADGCASDPYQGPLTGVAALLAACRLPLLLTVPVDIEHIPPACTARLRAALTGEFDAAVAIDDDGVQPLLALYRCALAGSAAAAFASGERSVRRWQAGLRVAPVAFSGMRVGNRNTLAATASAPAAEPR